MRQITAHFLLFFLMLFVATAPLSGRAAEDDHAGHGEEEKDHADHGDEEKEEHEAPGAVELSPDQREALGIETTKVSPGKIDSGIELLGEVHPNGDRLAHIVPRFAGIVRDVRQSAGDTVRNGDVLAVIESSDSLAPYELKTLIDGVVLTRHLTRGEAVDREKEAFVIADLSSVWVDLSVYQKDLTSVRVGQAVRVHSVHGGPGTEGVISYITPAVDQTTRTAVARVVLPNADRTWLPGMFVTGHTLDERPSALVVPRSAVQTLEGESVLFALTEHGFAARPVLLGQEGESLIEIVKGVSAGDEIASTNTFLLKAELAKGEAEHEH